MPLNEVQPIIQIATPSTGEEEWHAVRDPIMSGWLTQGPKVAEFERAFAERHHVEHAIATTSCTTALHLALISLGIGPGDEVIVPVFTWVATSNVVLYCGATPVFVDIDPHTYNLDPCRIAAAITSRTKAIIPVHLFGQCADMEAISAAAEGIPIVEDAACAAGAAYRGRPAGSLGRLGCFSFHPRKSITTGEGGMITTNDGELAETLIKLRNHGASVPEEVRHRDPKPYQMPEFNLIGFNYRMTDLQGAIGLVQLSKLDQFIDERSHWARFYCRELQDLTWLRTPDVSSEFRHGWQAFVCRIDEATALKSRNQLMEILQQHGISTRPGTHAIHTLGYYRDRFGLTSDEYPVAYDADQTTMAIPLHNRMTAGDYQYVVDTIKGVERSD